MKRYVYVLCLAVSLLGITSCSKNDPAPVSPAVGRWELNRGLLSGFSNANYNTLAIDLYYFEAIGSTIDIYSDNTFNVNYRSQLVDDATGTWDLTNNNLTLKYDAGDQETYTYSKNKNVEELTSTMPVSYTLPISTTASVGPIGKLTPVYRK